MIIITSSASRRACWVARLACKAAISAMAVLHEYYDLRRPVTGCLRGYVLGTYSPVPTCTFMKSDLLAHAADFELSPGIL